MLEVENSAVTIIPPVRNLTTLARWPRVPKSSELSNRTAPAPSGNSSSSIALARLVADQVLLFSNAPFDISADRGKITWRTAIISIANLFFISYLLIASKGPHHPWRLSSTSYSASTSHVHFEKSAAPNRYVPPNKSRHANTFRSGEKG